MSRPQCPRCIRPLSHCLCALIPSLPSRSRVVLLQHPSESGHALNTARLAALGLQNAELLIGERFKDLQSRLDDPGYRPCLLFPGADAEVLGAGIPREDSRPLLLVVPDGTWRKARKLLHLNPALAALPRLALPDGMTSRYRVRKAPAAGALSTLEAVVAALNLLESPASFDALLRPFERLIDGQIEAMGEETYRRNHVP
ncbi:DTW domain-containing protein [Pseudomonas kuykendallii]|uniref:tRNA-uridine aminocarboxypropyltransferase n=1 Tax=Pseudomonas kuykendallii TaxID=1007099 RepID=UPI0028D0A303|nr:DTW domain-containing protein [Pseudomonas kuykendallii]